MGPATVATGIARLKAEAISYRLFAITLGAAVTLTTGCATPTIEAVPDQPVSSPPPLVILDAPRPAPAAQPQPAAATPQRLAFWRSQVVGEAARQIGRKSVRNDRSDCAGFVRSVFRAVGLALPTGFSSRGSAAEAIAKGLPGRLHLKPLPGDLAIFHDTYDRNHDGELGDPFSHVAIVESADSAGRVSLIHFGGHGVARIVLDVSRPSVHKDGNITVNDYLRVRRQGDAPGTRYLAGELLAGFGTPSPREDANANQFVSARRSPAFTPRRPLPQPAPAVE
jgi:cell wall-associated NlpC family hydrolase